MSVSIKLHERKKSENAYVWKRSDVETPLEKLIPTDIAWAYVNDPPYLKYIFSANPDKDSGSERSVLLELQGFDATDPVLITRLYTDDADKNGHWGKSFYRDSGDDFSWEEVAEYIKGYILDGQDMSNKSGESICNKGESKMPNNEKHKFESTSATTQRRPFRSKMESNVEEATYKQGLESFIACAPEGGWSDYWAMQQDWEAFKDGLCRDGSITQRQADSWGNPCTPETFDRWQKRNGLTRRSGGYESKQPEPKKPDESNKSEATKFGAGMAKRTDFKKTKNLGEIMDVLDEHRKALKAAAEDVSKSKEDLEVAIKRLQEFEGYADFLKTQSVKGIKKALTLKNSPEVQAAGEVEKALKDALSIIVSDYKNIPDVTQLMVVIDSRYATRGSKILTTMEGQVSRAIDVDMKTIKDSIESGDVTEDDVMQYVTMSSVAHGVKDKGTVTKIMPVLERMDAMIAASTKLEEAVIDPQQFKDLRDLVEQIVKEASAPKDTIRTTITALDKGTIASVPESKQTEGLIDKLKELLSAIKDKIAGLWDSFTSLFFSIEDDALEAAEVFDDVELGLALVGIEVAESKKKSANLGKKLEVLTKSVLHCCDNLVKDTSLAGEFDDEVIYAEDAVKRVLTSHKNEDNMNVIGILSDAISQIVADEEGDAADAEGEEAQDNEDSVIDQVEREYSGTPAEPEEEEPPFGGEPEGGTAGEEEPEV